MELKTHSWACFCRNLTYACTGRLYIKLYIKHGIGCQECTVRNYENFYTCINTGLNIRRGAALKTPC